MKKYLFFVNSIMTFFSTYGMHFDLNKFDNFDTVDLSKVDTSSSCSSLSDFHRMNGLGYIENLDQEILFWKKKNRELDFKNELLKRKLKQETLLFNQENYQGSNFYEQKQCSPNQSDRLSDISQLVDEDKIDSLDRQRTFYINKLNQKGNKRKFLDQDSEHKAGEFLSNHVMQASKKPRLNFIDTSSNSSQPNSDQRYGNDVTNSVRRREYSGKKLPSSWKISIDNAETSEEDSDDDSNNSSRVGEYSWNGLLSTNDISEDSLSSTECFESDSDEDSFYSLTEEDLEDGSLSENESLNTETNESKDDMLLKERRSLQDIKRDNISQVVYKSIPYKDRRAIVQSILKFRPMREICNKFEISEELYESYLYKISDWHKLKSFEKEQIINVLLYKKYNNEKGFKILKSNSNYEMDLSAFCEFVIKNDENFLKRYGLDVEKYKTYRDVWEVIARENLNLKNYYSFWYIRARTVIKSIQKGESMTDCLKKNTDIPEGVYISCRSAMSLWKKLKKADRKYIKQVIYSRKKTNYKLDKIEQVPGKWRDPNEVINVIINPKGRTSALKCFAYTWEVIVRENVEIPYVCSDEDERNERIREKILNVLDGRCENQIISSVINVWKKLDQQKIIDIIQNKKDIPQDLGIITTSRGKEIDLSILLGGILSRNKASFLIEQGVSEKDISAYKSFERYFRVLALYGIILPAKKC